MSLFNVALSARPLSARTLLTLAAALFTVVAAAPMHASSITYDFSLTPTQGSIGGSGFFIVDGPPASSTTPGVAENTSYSGASLEALTFNIGGQTFTLAGDPTALVVLQTENGSVSLYDITFSEELNSGTDNRFDLQTSNPYLFSYNDEGTNATGHLTDLQLAPSASPVPEPGSLALFATGLFGGAATLYRRHATRS
jgi:hypothetical protein